MLVPKEAKAQVPGKRAAIFGHLKVGKPTDPTTMLGPVISAAQREVLSSGSLHSPKEEQHRREGRFRRGRPSSSRLDKGYYYEPTWSPGGNAGDFESRSRAEEEIFGPSRRHRLRRHGATDGADSQRQRLWASSQVSRKRDTLPPAPRWLAGYVAGARSQHRHVQRLCPGGGDKQSGLGRDRGIEEIRAFQEVKRLLVGELLAETSREGRMTDIGSEFWTGSSSVDVGHILEPPNLSGSTAF